ncbi:hypothetical protein GBF35_45960 [Nonomuraea phyllanthi]|uniref:hypothetical protein n=1 Tax=Nonomuraea phyllanthi TaxID=2219224 RepID=UPI0012940435|nr:hypothetical protein [Nonomuraea phyllanthi]QFY12935.1 hypothetical protein GBF35_45960 [Nonomuraea phyllanthi]
MDMPADKPDSPQARPEDPPYMLDQRTQDALSAAQHAAHAAAAEVAYLLQRALRLTGEPLYQAAYTQALRTWWEKVAEQIDQQHLQPDHALRRVRSWARSYLTAEIGSTQPGTLFDHALAHASRAAARRFLAATGELLAEHAARHDITLETAPDLGARNARPMPHHASAT